MAAKTPTRAEYNGRWVRNRPDEGVVEIAGHSRSGQGSPKVVDLMAVLKQSLKETGKKPAMRKVREKTVAVGFGEGVRRPREKKTK